MKKEHQIIIFLLLVAVILLAISLKVQTDNKKSGEGSFRLLKDELNRILTTNVFIENVQGNGHAFGDNNTVNHA